MLSVESLHDKLLTPTIPVGFVADVLLAPDCRGLDVDSILAANGLSRSMLKAAGVRISVDKYSRVLRQLRDESGDAFLGFLSRPLPIKAFNVFCYSVVGCRTFHEVVEQANQFYALFGEDIHWELIADGSDWLLVVDVKQTLAIDYRFIIQSLLLMTIRLFGWLLGEDIDARSVHFSFAKNSTDENLNYLFGPSIEYDCARNCVRLDGHYGRARLSSTRDQIEMMLRNTRHLFLLSRNRNPISQEVRRVLLAKKYDEWLDVDEMALALGVSPNQLWRKLNKEGTSFLDIRDQIKRDWSLVLLDDPVNTVEFVADQLRYSDVSAFRKAFKKWTGLQPVQYRNLLSER